MVPPLVALVAARLLPGRVEGWRAGAHAAPDTYVTALQRAGAQPVVLCGPIQGDPREVAERFDALVLLGGPDVDPELYGEPTHPRAYGIDRDRDEAEIAVSRAAAEAGLPTLAICRGVQVANVALGGTLIQHLPDVPGLGSHGVPLQAGSMHQVKLAEGSRVFAACGAPSVTGWSSHHQGIGRLGDGLQAVAWSGDGLIEAVEHQRGWFVGVQWHPEETAHRDPVQQGLFDALVRQAAARVRRR